MLERCEIFAIRGRQDYPHGNAFANRTSQNVVWICLHWGRSNVVCSVERGLVYLTSVLGASKVGNTEFTEFSGVLILNIYCFSFGIGPDVMSSL